MNPRPLLRSRQFLPLFIAQFLGACNDNIFKNALIIFIVFQLADSMALNAQFLVAMASGLFILPFCIFSLPAGQLADKYQKSRLIVIMKFVEVLLMPCAVLGFYWESITLLMASLCLLGVQATFFGPLKYAILPELLAKNELVRGNGLIQAATFIAILAGTIIGGIFIMTPHGKAIIASILLLLALLGWGSAWFIPPTQHTHFSQTVNKNMLREVWTLWRFARAHKPIFLSILGLSWFWLFGATILSILPPFTKTILQGDETVVTFLITIFSIGIALGSLIYIKIAQTKARSHAIYLSLLGLSVCTVDMAMVTHIPLASTRLVNMIQFLSNPGHYRVILDAVGLAMFAGIYTVPLNTLLQTQTPPTQRAQIIALNNIVNALFMIVSAVGIIGLTSIEASVQQTLWVIAAGSGLLTGYLYHQRTQTAA